MQQSEPRWLNAARLCIGIREVPGPRHHPYILQFWKEIRRGGIRDDETPWCSAFVGAMFERSGIRSTRYESARSWLDWGGGLAEPAYGCVVVLERDGGGHVGFIVGEGHHGSLMVLGGNQSDAVNIRAFPRTRVVGYRWPSGEALDRRPLPRLAHEPSLTEK